MQRLADQKQAAATSIQRSIRAKWGRRKGRERRRVVNAERELAATRVIQAHHRGIRGRREVEAMKRRQAELERQAEKRMAAIHIQAIARGKQGRAKADKRRVRLHDEIQRDYEAAQSDAQKQLVRDFERRKAAEVRPQRF